jgi:GT2 family glycosyltransferase
MTGRSSRPRIAVVVVNYNGGAVLERCLRALAAQTAPPARIVVVDNASSDGSTDGLEGRFAELELLRLGENAGFAAGNNVAVRHADDCDWVALLNPDAFPEPGWLEALEAAAASRPDFAFFASRLVMADDPARLDGAGDALHTTGVAWRRHHGEPAVGRGTARQEVFSPCGAAALYRRDAFLDSGGFDERYFCYFEDTDLAFRLRLRGHRCLYVPEAVVHHVGSATAGRSSDFTLFHVSRNLVWTYVKDMPGRLFWLYLPQLAAGSLFLLAAYAGQGRARPVLRGYLAAVRGLPPLLAARREVQQRRSVPAREVRRALTRGLRPFLENTTRLRGRSLRRAS